MFDSFFMNFGGVTGCFAVNMFQLTLGLAQDTMKRLSWCLATLFESFMSSLCSNVMKPSGTTLEYYETHSLRNMYIYIWASKRILRKSCKPL